MGKFLRLQCECGSERVVFGNSSSDVYCNGCGNSLVEATGGRAKIGCKITEVLSH